MRAEYATAAGEPAILEVAAVRHERPGRGQRPSQLGQGVVAYVVEDEVVLPPGLREVLPAVVDDVVGADRANQLDIPGAAHAGHLRAEGLGDLHRERADPTRRAVDQDRLPGRDMAVIAKRLEGDHRRHRDRRGLLEGDVDRHPCKRVLGGRGVLGIGAAAPAEDLVARAEPGHAAAHRLDRPGDVGPANDVLRLAQPVDGAGDVRQPAHDRPVGGVDPCRPNANQHLIVGDRGLVDLASLHHLSRAVRVLDHGLHRRFPSVRPACVRCTLHVYGVR